MIRYILFILLFFPGISPVKPESTKEIMTFLKTQNKKFKPAKEKVVVMIGDTVTGKSTLSLLITGAELESVETTENSGGFYIIDEHEKIGSTTLIPDRMVLKTDDEEIKFYDCPGFEDGASLKREIAAAYLINKLFQKVASFKIVFVVHYTSVIKGMYRSTFPKFIGNMVKLLRMVEPYKTGIAMVATKVPNEGIGEEDDIKIIDDETMKHNVGNYLEEEKRRIQNETHEGLSEENLKLNNQKLKILEILLEKEEGHYSKIGIFRTPEEAGDLKDMELIQNGTKAIVGMIKGLEYVEKNEELGFGNVLSSESDLNIKSLLDQLVQNDLSDSITSVLEEMKKYYDGVFQNNKDFAHLSTTMKDAQSKISEIDFQKPLSFAKSLVKIAEKRNVSEASIQNVKNHIQYTEFLLKIHDIQLSIPVTYKDKIKDFTKYMKVTYDKYVNLSMVNTLSHKLPSKIEVVCGEIENYYEKLEVGTNDIYILNEKLSSAYENLSKVNISNPRSLLHAIKQLQITLLSKNSDELIEMVDQINFALKKTPNYATMLQPSQKRIEKTTEHLHEATLWYSFLIEIYNDFALLQHETYEKEETDIKNIIKTCPTLSIKVRDLHLEKLSNYTKKKYSTIDSLKNVSLSVERKRILVTVFTRLLNKPTITCNDVPENMTVTGYIIRMSHILNDTSCWPKAKSIEILALDSFIIDSSLDKKSENFQMAVIAPAWAVVGDNRVIKLKGGDVGTKEDAHDALDSTKSLAGDNGEAGYPGQPGGNFLGIGQVFVNGQKLTIVSEGGDGGKGQKGGKGSSGKDASKPKHVYGHDDTIKGCLSVALAFDTMRNCLIRFCNGNKYEFMPNMTIEGDSFKWRQYGLRKRSDDPGTNGGDGGHGGLGGSEGKPGHIKMIELGERSKVFTNFNDGNMGISGEGGLGGGSAIKSYVMDTTVSGTYINGLVANGIADKTLNDRVFPSGSTEIGKTGETGGSPKEQAKPKDADEFYYPSRVVNKYKNLIRQHLNKDFKESQRRQFLTQMEEHTKDLYNVHGLIDELNGMEHQYSTLQTQTFFIPFYESYLSQINEYSKMRNLTADETEVFKYLKASVTSKLFGLNKNHHNRQIYDLTTFLSEVKKEITDLKTATSNVAMNDYRKNYEESFDAKKKAAQSFVDDDIMPEIRNIFRKMDQDVLGLIDETIEIARTTKNDQEAYVIKKGILTENMLLHMHLAPIKMIGTVLSFCVPEAAAASAVIMGATSIYESAATQETGNIEHEPLSKRYKKSVQQLNINFNNKLAVVKGQVRAIKDITIQYLSKPNGTDKATTNLCIDVKQKMERYESVLESIENSSYDKLNAPNVDTIKLELARFAHDLKNSREKKNGRSKREAEEHGFDISGKIEAIAGCADVPIGIFNVIKEDEAKIREASEVIAELGKEMKTLQQQEKNIYNIMIPGLRNMKEQIESLEKLAGQSHAELTFNHWKIQNVLRDVMSMFNQMTRGSSVEQDFQLSLAKIEAGMSTLISMYDLMDSYADSQRLGSLITDVSTEVHLGKKIQDKELFAALTYLKQVIHSNIVLEKYNLAIDGIKQHYFPVIEQFFVNKELPEGLDMTDMESLTQKAADHVGALMKTISNQMSQWTEYDSSMHRGAFFDGTTGDKNPFYVWKNKFIKKQLQQLFNGETIMLVADIRNGIDENVVKFRRIGLHFELLRSTKEKQENFNDILKRFYVSMTLSGNNYYRCNDRIYSMPLGRDIEYKYRMEMGKNNDWRNEIITVEKIRKNDAFLSPFTTWKIKLSGDFDELANYKNKSMDLQLIGFGQYLEPQKFIADVCNDRLDAYYNLDGVEDRFATAG